MTYPIRESLLIKVVMCSLVLMFLPLLSIAATWKSEIRLSAIWGQSWGPQIVAHNGTLHVVWFEYPNFVDPEIYYSRSTDNGDTWSVPRNISNNPNRQDTFPFVAADAYGVYVFWSSDSMNGEIFFKLSRDSGVTWEAEQQLSNASGYSRSTDILVDKQGMIHIVWYDLRGGNSEIYHRQSCDHGATWSSDQCLTQFDGVVDNEDPKIVQAEDGTLFVLFRSSRSGIPLGGWPPYDIYLVRSKSSDCTSGTTWFYPAQRISRGLPDHFSNHYGGSISAGKGGRLHVIYWEEDVGNQIVYRRGIPNGAGWSNPNGLTGLPLNHPEVVGPSIPNPGLTEDHSGSIHLLFSERKAVRDGLSVGKLYYRKSGDGGLTWNPVTQLGTSDSTCAPRAIYYNGRVHVVWVDFRDNNYGSEIYYRNLDLNIKLTPLNDTAEFVRQQYRDFLNREADDGGLQYWVNLIDTGAMTKAQVIESFFWSQEFGVQIAPVARLYFAYFLRIPDYEGLQYWINEYKNGKPLQWISDFFAASQEFQQRYGSLNNQQFVELIYQNIMGRSPDAGGLAFWTDELNSGRRTRGQVMLEFSESPEYKQTSSNEVYVTMMYIGMLRRSPEEGGFNFSVNYLDSGNSGLALINGFLSSAEYANRFQ